MAGLHDSYADLADLYDSMTSDRSLQAFYHEWTDSLLEALRRSKVRGRVFVDLACGTGNMAIPWSRRRGWTVVGVDRSSAMLRQAKKSRAACVGTAKT